MKIAVWYDLPSGGALRALGGQLQMLESLGHRIAVWTPESFEENPSDIRLPAQIERKIVPLDRVTVTSVLDRYFSAPLHHNRIKSRAFERHAMLACQEMEKWGAEVLFVHPCWWSHVSPLAVYWKGASVLYLQEPTRALHEATPDNGWMAPKPIGTKSLKTRAGSWIRDNRYITMRREQLRDEVTWLRCFDRVLVNSRYSRESVLRASGVDARFCPLGVDHEPFLSAPVMKKERMVVSLGLLSANKGALLAVRALSRIPEQLRPPFHWLGNREDPDYRREVEALAAQLNVSLSISIGLPDEMIVREMARAACFLYCAHLEPLGFAPLEANLARTAVVAVAEGGVRETIRDGVNGLLAPCRDEGTLATLMMHYLNDLAVAKEVGAAARVHVLQNHSWASAGKTLEHHLQQTIATRAGGQ